MQIPLCHFPLIVTWRILIRTTSSSLAFVPTKRVWVTAFATWSIIAADVSLRWSSRRHSTGKETFSMCVYRSDHRKGIYSRRSKRDTSADPRFHRIEWSPRTERETSWNRYRVDLRTRDLQHRSAEERFFRTRDWIEKDLQLLKSIDLGQLLGEEKTIDRRGKHALIYLVRLIRCPSVVGLLHRCQRLNFSENDIDGILRGFECCGRHRRRALPKRLNSLKSRQSLVFSHMGRRLATRRRHPAFTTIKSRDGTNGRTTSLVTPTLSLDWLVILLLIKRYSVARLSIVE